MTADHHSTEPDCSIMVFEATWLNSGIPDSTIKLTGHYTLREDRTEDDSGKTRAGGLSISVNKTRCTSKVTALLTKNIS